MERWYSWTLLTADKHCIAAASLIFSLRSMEETYYLRQKKRNALEESWFIVARSVQIHSLDDPDSLSSLYDPPAPPWPPSSSTALIHTACGGSCALCLSQLFRRWLKLQLPIPTLITALYGFRIEQTTRDSETVLNSLQSECNRDSVALFV